MSRIAATFKHLRQQNRAALIPFVTAGDPYPGITVSLMHTLVAAGADIVELGVPFSDPMAEGPVIQRASERAVAQGVSLRSCLEMVSRFRSKNQETPVVLMGYLNPIEVMGYEAFAQAAETAGVDGVLTVDMPPEECGDLAQALRGRGIDPIFLLAPTSTTARIKKVASQASGFIYYVSLRGVTGAKNMDTAEVTDKLREIRQNTNLPLGVGFGIQDPETAAQMAKLADAVVVGSALVKRIEAVATDEERVLKDSESFVASLRAAIDRERDHQEVTA